MARIKKVFTSSLEVIHLYAQRTQDEARSGSCFFNGDKIYSYGYHYLLGEFITNKAGAVALVINDKGYSSTTNKQISELRSASRQYKQFFTTETNLALVLAQIKTNIEKLQTARKKELYINPCLKIWEALNQFIDWTGHKDMRKDEQYKKIAGLMAVVNGSDYKTYLAKEQKRITANQRKAEKLRADKLKADILKFEAYEIDYITGSNTDYLRLSKCGSMVETSQRIKVTVKEAKMLYSLILAKKDIRGFKISDYIVTSINGTLKIGCHSISIESVNKVGMAILSRCPVDEITKFINLIPTV